MEAFAYCHDMTPRAQPAHVETPKATPGHVEQVDGCLPEAVSHEPHRKQVRAGIQEGGRVPGGDSCGTESPMLALAPGGMPASHGSPLGTTVNAASQLNVSTVPESEKMATVNST
jgi:hypothetical protein